MLMKNRGFTLIEMMIVVVILAILVTVAIPSYQEQVQKGRRADGKAFLLDITSRQERFYTQFSSYTGVLAKPASCSGAACGLGLGNNNSPDGLYSVSVTATPADCSPTTTLCTGYTLTATPSWTDAKCGNLTLTSTAIRGKSGTQTVEYCWR